VRIFGLQRASVEDIRPGAILDKRLFIGLNLDYMKFENVSLKGATFLGCSMVKADLSELRLDKVVFDQCNLYYSNFRNSVLREAEFVECNLDDAVFCNCDMRDATIEASTLARANMFGVILSGAKLSRVSLTDADLTCAYLDDVEADKIDLYGATLSTNYMNAGLYEYLLSLGAKVDEVNLVCDSKGKWCPFRDKSDKCKKEDRHDDYK
jgi:uncharacterized protein YjbI with pentapeptide repeats